jgi:hypothetical protein
MISLASSPSLFCLSRREASAINTQQMFPNMLAQLMTQRSDFTSAMANHIDFHRNLYECCPPYRAPHESAFETLTPNPGVDQSIMIDGQYRLDVTKNGDSSSTYKVYDKDGKELAGAWGDPHMTGKNGEAVGDLQGNHVLTLPNGAQIGVRVSDAVGGKPMPGQVAYCSEITVTSANRSEAMNFNFNTGTSKTTTGTHISGYLGENFNAETLSDHGQFLGAQIGVSAQGGLFDPLTGQAMTANRLKEIDLNSGDPKVREKAIHLAMAQELYGQGYLTPTDHLLHSNTRFCDFMETRMQRCLANLQSLLMQMTRMNPYGCGCSMRLPNHIDSNRDLMLRSFGHLPKPYACPTLSAAFNPMLANYMPEGAACKAIGTYLQQKGTQAVSIEDLEKISNDQSVPPIVRNACAYMVQHPQAWRKVETNDTGGRGKDNWSGNWNFLDRANKLGAQDWTPIMSPPRIDFFHNYHPQVW